MKSPRRESDRGRNANTPGAITRHVRNLPRGEVVAVSGNEVHLRCPKCAQVAGSRNVTDALFSVDERLGTYMRANRSSLDHTNRRIVDAMRAGWKPDDDTTAELFNESPVNIELSCKRCRNWFLIDLRTFTPESIAKLLPIGLENDL